MTPPPPSFLKPYGMVREIADWIDSVSPYKNRVLSVSSALAIMATLCGRRYALTGGMRSVLYLVGVADSGFGKEAGRQAASRLFDRCGFKQRVGSGDFASETGLVVQLREHPSRLFMVDEFGRMIAGFTHKNAGSHERQIMTTLMKLWGNAGSHTFYGKAYAEKPTIKIEEPHCVVYGTTTHAAFWRAIQGNDIVDGVLSRLLIVPVDGDRGAYCKPSDGKHEPPSSLVAKCKAIATGPPMGNLASLDSSDLAGVHLTIQMSDAAEAASDKVRETADVLAKKAGPLRDLWRRAHEQTLRLALTMAVSYWPEQCAIRDASGLARETQPVVDETDILWAWRMVKWCTARMADSVGDLVADTDEERCALAIVRVLRTNDGGAGKNAITRATQGYPHRTREAALSTLLDSERVVKDTRPSRGRSAVWYRLATIEEDTDSLAETTKNLSSDLRQGGPHVC